MRKRTRGGMALAIASGVSAALAGCGPDTTVDDDAPALTPAQKTVAAGCPPCEAELETRAVLTDSAGEGFFHSTRPIARRDGMGRYHAATIQSSHLLVFDSTGVQVDLLGRRGEGPGEFQWAIPPARGPGDSLLAWDVLQRRTAVFSPSLEFVRDYRFPFPPMHVFNDGSILVNQQIPDPDYIGYPLHVVSPEGDILRSFGQDPPEFRLDRADRYYRALAFTDDGRVWTSPTRRLELEFWDPATGERLRELPTEWPDFRVDDRWGQEGGVRRNEPPTVLEGMIHHPQGVLWILLRHAAPDWEPIGGDAPLPELRLDESERFYQWVVLAVDEASGEILGEGRFGHRVTGVPGADFFVSGEQVVADHVEVEIWEPVLMPPGGP